MCDMMDSSSSHSVPPAERTPRFAERLMVQFDLLGHELEQFEVLRRVRRWCKRRIGWSVPLLVAGGGLLSLLALFLFIGLGAPLLCNIVGTVLPAVETLKLLEPGRRSPHLVVQWFSYWCVFGLFAVLESTVTISRVIPPYYSFKLGFLLFCFLPPSNMGAKFLYDQTARLSAGNGGNGGAAATSSGADGASPPPIAERAAVAVAAPGDVATVHG